MQNLSEPGAQRPTMGAYLLGKTKTWKNTFRNRELLPAVLRACPSSELEPLCYDSGPVFLTPDQQSALGGTEADRAC